MEPTIISTTGRMPTFDEALKHAAGLIDAGRAAEGLKLFRRLVVVAPGEGACWGALARWADAVGRTDIAIALISRAIVAQPTRAQSWNDLGNLLDALKRPGARRAFERAVALGPVEPDHWANLARQGLVEDRIAAGMAAYRRALFLAPDHADSWAGLGMNALAAGRPPADADRALSLAVALRPDLAAALNGLGLSLERRRRDDEARRWYDRGCRTGGAEAWLNRGLLDLRRGDLADGWAGYAWRFASRGYVDRVAAARPWRGEPLKGRRITVWREQGVGDELLFSRLLGVPGLDGATVTMECDRRLIPLFGRSFPAVRFVAEAGDMADSDFHSPIGSLPGLMGMGLRDVVGNGDPGRGWLRADPVRIAKWRERLEALGPGIRVGLSWRSGMMGWDRVAAHTRLTDWIPLTAVPGVTLIDLQYGEHGRETAAFEEASGARLHRWSDIDLRDDLDEVAALVSALDLVVCTATAVGELAGALGIPVWRLGGRDWTFLGTGTRPWFPSMRAWTPQPGERLADVPARMAVRLREMSAHEAAAAPSRGFDVALEAYRAGRWDEARRDLVTLMENDPDFGRGRHLLAVIANRQGRPADARAAILEALGAGYDDDAAYVVLGAACLTLGVMAAADGRLDEAVAFWREALAARPGDRGALIDLGQAASRAEDFGRARVFLTRALTLDPTDAAAWTGLGTAKAWKRGDDGGWDHRVALALAPELAEAWSALGLALERAAAKSGKAGGGDVAAALRAYGRAVTLDPHAATAHYNAGLLLLRAGDLRGGWAEHDWRFATPQFRGQGRRPPSLLWRGGNLHGLRMLVWREQGVGDEVLFSSCLPDLAARAGRTIIQCDRRLAPLFARSFPDAVIMAEAVRGVGPLPAHDVNSPAGSLPRWLRGEIARFPIGDGRPGHRTGGWLVADPARRRFWRARLDALGPGLKIGIAWRSGLIDAGRREAYLDVMDWEPVLRLPHVRFVNLQYGDTSAERTRVVDRLGVTLAVWDDLDLKDDLDGLAAMMAELDLVLSPAMSAGELAAAVGTPVWRVGGRDWTWLGTGVRPWFPTMRVWAPRPGEALADVPRRVAGAILGLMEPPRPASSGRADRKTGNLAAWMARADADLVAGRWVAAAEGYGRIVAEDPTNARAWAGLGAALGSDGRTDPSADALGRALALSPDNAAAWTTLGNVLSARGVPEHAERRHRRAVTVAPGLLPAWDNLGVVLTRLGRVAEAGACHDRVLAADPFFLPAWINRADAMRRQGMMAAARRSLRMALVLAPDDIDAVCNLTRLIVSDQERPLTDPWMDRASRLAPSSPIAAFNRGVALLAEGRLRDGWEGYDARFLADAIRSATPDPGCPPWMGEPLNGRTLFVWGAQGIGDQFMFATTLPDVILRTAPTGTERSGRVVIAVESRLVSLFRRSFPGASVVVDDAAAPRGADHHAALCSLPRWTRNHLSDFPAGGAWMRPDPDRVALWGERLATLPAGLRVGLSWRSGLLTGDRRDEYTALEAWAPLFAPSGPTVVNLMYGAEDEIAAFEARRGARLHRWPDLDPRDDLEGLAALIANLDLVIAPATSVGEMAGALGVPVWRFGKRGSWTTLGTAVRPWFPTMRLFTPRQGEGVDVLPARIVAELKRLSGGG